MAAPTEIYVDPAIAADSGSGTIGSPYGDIQYALNTATRDGTNGDRFNIKAGTDEILTAALSLATYGTPTEAARLTLQGYTSAAGDGGIGGISGAATYSIISSATLDYISFIDMHLHNSGAANIVFLDSYCNFRNCEFNNTSGNGVLLTALGSIDECRFHDIGTYGVIAYLGCTVTDNHFMNGTKTFVGAAVGGISSCSFQGNIISVGGASHGIIMSTPNHVAIRNSVLSSGGTGTGILGSTTNTLCVVKQNVVEGFSGTGGVGIGMAAVEHLEYSDFNAVFNCATAYNAPVLLGAGNTNNETLAAGNSPFLKEGADTYANRKRYFYPRNIGAVVSNAKGAVPVSASTIGRANIITNIGTY